MSEERERLETPTDVLVTCMEEAENCEHLLVIATRKDLRLMIVNHSTTLTQRLGMLEAAKHILLAELEVDRG